MPRDFETIDFGTVREIGQPSRHSNVHAVSFDLSGREPGIRVFAEMPVSIMVLLAHAEPGEYCGIVKLFMSPHQSFGKAACSGHAPLQHQPATPGIFCKSIHRPKTQHMSNVISHLSHSVEWTSICGLMQPWPAHGYDIQASCPDNAFQTSSSGNI
jgi:hypothetical protein